LAQTTAKSLLGGESLTFDNLKLIILAALAMLLGWLVLMTDRQPEERPRGYNQLQQRSPPSPEIQISPVSPQSPIPLSEGEK
jgi:hypothetical protein